MNLLIMGLPGAGKGTQAAKIVEKFNVAHISTGDMFRAAMANQTEMGILAKSYIDKGDLVPDEVTNGIVKERLVQDDIKEKGFLLDGYPRTIEQAHALDENLADLGIELQGVINIEIDPSKLVERLSGRIIHKETGETFHKVFNPPVGDYKEEDFYQREDDKPESVKRRLEVNIAQGQPIIDHYRAKGLVHDIEGDQDIDLVFQAIDTVLSKSRVVK
ncbi:adenylate kinase [Streptococcus suis]|uniref:adenylate kinase n=3 Tax=Streptococcus suis TaxID=1307 RepID=UPI003A4E062B